MPTPETPIRSVLFVLQSVAAGGMETHVVDLAAEYVRRAITTSIIVPSNAELDGVADRFADGGVATHRLDTDARRGRMTQLRQLWGTFRLMRQLRPDVVHVQTGGATGGAATVLLGRLAGARVIITEHDVPDARPGLHQRWARRILDAGCHAIIAVSRRNGTLRLQRLGGPRRRCAAILNGVPIPDIDPTMKASHRASVRQELGIDDAELVIGSVVRLAEGKGLRDLFEAFAQLGEGERVRLLLVGDGPLKDELSASARRLEISDRVTLAGHRADPAPFLDAMDLFVLPVPAGSMSIALLEAMARGVPPMITFCGPEEAVIPGVSGYCAPPADADGLSRALAAALAEPRELSKMGQQAAQHVRHHFSVARLADDTLAVYAAAGKGDMPPRLRVEGAPNPLPGGVPTASD